MSLYADICDWLRNEYEKKGLVPTLEQLELRRLEVATRFELIPTNSNIFIAFEKYLKQRPASFIYPTSENIINGKRDQDTSWITASENRFYWNNLKAHLVDINRGSSISSLDFHSEVVLKNLASSNSKIPAHVKGLVVGYIQSGKTANMVAVSAKAVDSGYKMVIVLGGLLNSLRQQTQLRFDQELTGGDKQLWQNNWKDLKHVSIGKIDREQKRWQRFTGADSENPQKGDISNSLQSNPNLMKTDQAPILFVIKKTPAKIKALAKFIKDSCQGPYPFPVLILDDESDQATINTKYHRQEVTSSNESIRELLQHFSICSYVGYTATPYANILIDPTFSSEELGRDLFPKDFIYPIDPPPPGYFGVKELFGINTENPENSSSGLDVFVTIPQDEIRILNSPNPAPSGIMQLSSLTDALSSFIISSLIRLRRGHNQDDFSMLIHPSSYTHIQNNIYFPLVEYIDGLKKNIKDRVFFENFLNKLEINYQSSFKAMSLSSLRDLSGDGFLPDSIVELKEYIVQLILSVDVLLLHSGSTDKIQYGDHSNPKRYIIVGGNKLSRGLTIEGLSVSYFCRNSKTYDTLLQMGRWFGYRGAYVDLTRIFLSREARDNFQNVAYAELDLRAQLSEYANDNKSPLEVLPRIVQLPNLLVTARNKLGAGKKQAINFSNYRPEKTLYDFENPQSLVEFNKECLHFLENLKGNASHITKSVIEGEYIINSLLTSAELSKELINKVELGNIDKRLLNQFLEKSSSIEWVSIIVGKNEGDYIEEVNISGNRLGIKGLKRSLQLASPNRFGTILGTTELNRFRDEIKKFKNYDNIGMVIFHFVDCKYLYEFSQTSILPKYIIAPVFVFPKADNYVEFDRIGLNELSDKEKELLHSELPLIIEEDED